MSTLAIADSPIPRTPRPRPTHPRSDSSLSHVVPDDKHPRKQSVRVNARKKEHSGHRMLHAIRNIESWVQYLIAVMLIGIVIAMLVETAITLMTAPGPLNTAASHAVGNVLVILIIVEITRTVITSPSRKGIEIRRFLIIAIVSVLRELLWVSTTHQSLQLGISTAAVLVLAGLFVLIDRTSTDRVVA